MIAKKKQKQLESEIMIRYRIWEKTYKKIKQNVPSRYIARNKKETMEGRKKKIRKEAKKKKNLLKKGKGKNEKKKRKT